MPEEQQAEANDLDAKMDKVLDEVEKETPAESSTETKPEDTDKTEKPAGAEPEKTEQVKAVEADESLSVEDKIEKVKEILGDDQKAIDAYVKEKGYHNDPAWIKQREIIDKLTKESETKAVLSEQDRVALDDFKALSSSPEFIQMTMKQKGFTQEAIDKELKDKGFDVQAKAEDVFQMVLDQTGTKKENLTEAQIAQIEDVIKVTDILLKDRMGKSFSKELDPIKDHISKSEQDAGGAKIISTIKDTIKTEGILDYDKDIEPALNKFLDENPDAAQQDVLEHFKTINHSLTIDRLKVSNNKGERDEKKGQIRQNTPLSKTLPNLPDKTRNFDKDADAFLDTAGVQ